MYRFIEIEFKIKRIKEGERLGIFSAHKRGIANKWSISFNNGEHSREYQIAYIRYFKAQDFAI